MLDDLDRQILRLLSKNARFSFRELAMKLGVSTSTVSARVKRLEEGHLVRGYLPDIDPRAVGLELTAIIGLRIGMTLLTILRVRNVLPPDQDRSGPWVHRKRLRTAIVRLRQIALRRVVAVIGRGVEPFHLEVFQLDKRPHQSIGENARIGIDREGLLRRRERSRAGGEHPVLGHVLIR